MRLRRIAPIERAIDAAEWEFSEFLYSTRCRGVSWQNLAEANGISRSTARRYAQVFEMAGRRYGWVQDHAPSCNAISFRCAVCGEEFNASRADARYCSSACRQDAYRMRKQQ